jgi:tRNA dimethylallyltransferase
MTQSAGESVGLIKDAILIAGPTASGKSALAVALARKIGGLVINADSMQVYSVLHVLTARPGPADLEAAPHYLYGHVHPATSYSTGAWVEDVRRLSEDGVFSKGRPIFVGGTGLYFRALTQGLSDIPEIPREVRGRWRRRLSQEGPERLHHILTGEDPEAAATIRPTDGQRIVRALEVLEASGRSIRRWQAEQGRILADPNTTHRFVIQPDRQTLLHRISERFDRMIEQGALEEVKTLMALALDPELPVMKAHGVRELQSAIAGGVPLDHAIEQTKIVTRQYAKRQMTWLRHQMGPEWVRVSLSYGQEPAEEAGRLLSVATV